MFGVILHLWFTPCHVVKVVAWENKGFTVACRGSYSGLEDPYVELGPSIAS